MNGTRSMRSVEPTPIETPARDRVESDLELADALLRRLFPLCRSLSGAGVRQTLSVLAACAPFSVHEIPSGTQCLDWAVPDEWNVRDAFVADGSGRRIIDFRASNVHLVS